MTAAPVAQPVRLNGQCWPRMGWPYGLALYGLAFIGRLFTGASWLNQRTI